MATPRKLKQSELPTIKRELIAKQNGACLFCGGNLTGIASVNQVVDHNHSTGIIRGVAHRACNGIEGKVLKLLTTFGRCRDRHAVIKMMKRLIMFWENEPKTEYIYPSHKSPAEKRDAKNKKARKLYAKKKEQLNAKRKA